MAPSKDRLGLNRVQVPLRDTGRGEPPGAERGVKQQLLLLQQKITITLLLGMSCRGTCTMATGIGIRGTRTMAMGIGMGSH